ncbi:MAG: hypothetical protein R3237_02170 [Nitrosopumilaceae archaeon]|nr:hypothetical protein [Nitrosopumilaceae archaeon]
MKDEKIQKLIEEINLRESKNYQNMEIEKLSGELRKTMSYEAEIFQKIDKLEKSGTPSDLTNYARMIAKNTTGRQIAEIQEIYFKKIDKKYLKSK